MLKCGECENEFERSSPRGRSPKTCPDCKGKAIELARRNRERREEAGENGLTGVPVFESITSVRLLPRDGLVYHLPKLIASETLRRRYAMEYSVDKVDGEMLNIVRTEKCGHKPYHERVHFSRLYKKVGVEYLKLDQEERGEESE